MTLDEQRQLFSRLMGEIADGGASLAAVLDERDPFPDISYCAAIGALTRLLDRKVNIALAVEHAQEMLKLAAPHRKVNQ